MRAGSVIVDMAAESGGNVEGAVAGETKRIHGVTVIGARNIAALMPADTSALFSRNLFNFLSAFWDKEQGRPVLDEEIGNAVRLTQGGQVVNERLLG
jgi:NAD(P) transhydrogenase subunit alpha